ncbi:MAG: iron ABC transporter permease [Candidatus Methanomethylophilaceae archaeon]|nr:iron ABC transporter permease [Candidatus Methanomethylophilaceae archaeon]MBR6870622.1 iron ABC transporter permease [Candidatus Methanomethylophilaceae archaeon]
MEIWNAPAEADRDDTTNSIIDKYKKYVMRKWVFIFVCIVAMMVVILFALTIGEYPLSVERCYEIIWQFITGHQPANASETLENSIIFDIRLPRIYVGILAGAGLAAAGVAMQSTLMNPLADPYTTGVSSGASFGATIGIVLEISLFGVSAQYTTVINAFVFSLIPMAMIILLSKARNGSPTTMIMAGIAIMYIFNAFTTLISLMAEPTKLEQLYRWTVGSLTFAGSSDVLVMAVFVIPGIIILQFLTSKLNILSTGDDTAKSLGVDADRMRRIILLVVALIAAAVVSFTGLIGFVGLVAPHIVRIFVGPDNRFLLPASAAFGALLLIFADLVGRVIIAPAELQVGVVTAFMGGPLFLWLIIRKNTKVWG